MASNYCSGEAVVVSSSGAVSTQCTNLINDYCMLDIMTKNYLKVNIF